MRYFILCSCFFFSLNPLFTNEDPAEIFPEISGWTIDNFKNYSPNNLYAAINGAAELFLKYDFVSMQRVDYLRDSNYISVEVYQHETPINAFGVYSREKPEKNIYFEIGVQGYKENDYLFFNAGQYYIKIRTLIVNEISIQAMQDIALKLAFELNCNAVFPQFFSAFPTQHKIKFSEKYYDKNILGFDFLHSSYEVTYKKEDNDYTLFLLEGKNEVDAQKMLANYFAYFDLPFKENNNNYYIIADRYNGDVFIVKKDRYLICSRGQISSDESLDILKEISLNIH